ncbi:MAG: enoyl-(Acyl-carrier-protein) reductase [Candidatus Xenolissoclinum pacificiensis L6]|uniref:Enoyl-[acyl-carrier-protein] reductase [NADH] n=1 Tax=Candidatus Xenolissoclinum pacificiensis L6 TaxID=1401685 RepID=W2V188_9RICK|nr:MAG: enoyl-(Acyl-carrier-protein) reductase [Candidatus Xenolissoclinum pacificiensis L6]
MLVKGKKGIVLGVANKWSIAYSVAKLLHNEGAEIILTYGIPQLEKRVIDVSKELNNSKIMFYDAGNNSSSSELVSEVQKFYPSIDFIVHAIAFSDKNELKGEYHNISRDNFSNSMNISCYSLIDLANAFQPLMKKNGGSIVTFSYYGGEKFVPNYNVMGTCKAALENMVKYMACSLGGYNIRINALSAGPLKTLSSSGISNFGNILDWVKQNSPMQRNVSAEEVAKVVLFLISDLSTGITGEVIHVDCGYNVIGVPFNHPCNT